MPFPSAGVAVRWMSRPARSTPRASGLPTERFTMSVSVVGLLKVLPSMETTVSPGFSPASAAGVCVPDQCSMEAMV